MNAGNDNQKRVRQPKKRKRETAEEAEHKQELDDMLDEALQETFPASDPVSVLSKLRVGRRRKAKAEGK